MYSSIARSRRTSLGNSFEAFRGVIMRRNAVYSLRGTVDWWVLFLTSWIIYSVDRLMQRGLHLYIYFRPRRLAGRLTGRLAGRLTGGLHISILNGRRCSAYNINRPPIARTSYFWTIWIYPKSSESPLKPYFSISRNRLLRPLLFNDYFT